VGDAASVADIHVPPLLNGCPPVAARLTND
jgi:hypothetical protein